MPSQAENRASKEERSKLPLWAETIVHNTEQDLRAQPWKIALQGKEVGSFTKGQGTDQVIYEAAGPNDNGS